MFAEARVDVIEDHILADWSLADRLEVALHVADANLYTKNDGRNRCVTPAA
ncbi:hypothetical protein [Rhizobium esperanzae]|uniref:hypothetical protein n=1 Tax=Rhizobium esperanzae TaxID=1967781 RepID=UPI001595ED38|nr:hypothetical protein [Rhizobium esperanzae]